MVDIVVHLHVGRQADMIAAMLRTVGEHRRGVVGMIGNVGIQVATRIGRAVAQRREAGSSRRFVAGQRGGAGAVRQAGPRQ